MLANFPEWPESWQQVQQFPQQLNNYYADHFGGRSLLTRWYSKLWQLSGFIPPEADVIAGKQDWLFLGKIMPGYTKYDDPIGDVMRNQPYSDHALKQLVNRMEQFRKKLQAHNIQYLFFIAPNKHSIYREYLPDYISPQAKFTATDQLLQYLQQHSQIDSIDMRPALMSAKEQQQLYFKTDSHWNDQGANIAQFEIMQWLQKQYPNQIKAEKYPSERFLPSGRLNGDLNRLLRQDHETEAFEQIHFISKCQPTPQINHLNPLNAHHFFCPKNQLDALIFGDSFLIALQPFLSREFRHSIFLLEKISFDELLNIIEKNPPDIVIHEIVERALPESFNLLQ